MKRPDPSKPPFLSWCLIVRNAEKTLEATLKSLRERTPDAEIVIVDTCSSDSTPEISQRYADVFEVYRGPRGDWDELMPFFDDAAAARQRSFELASGIWRGWIDSDDVLPGPDTAIPLLQQNKQYCTEGMGGGAVAKVEGAGEKNTLEEQIKKLESLYPQADCIWAPYLYQRAADGTALVWQERERIVRWNPKRWGWREKAHEILVPLDGNFPPRVVFSHLLFVHEKDWNQEAVNYAVARHFDVLEKAYRAGERTTRRCLYLAQYASMICPEREMEFIEAGHACATNTVDRYKMLLQKAGFYAGRGLLIDAAEAFAAATALHPALPDAWFAGAQTWSKNGDAVKAIEWFQKGLAGKLDPASLVAPREMTIKYRWALAEEYGKLGDLCIKAGKHKEAADAYNQGQKEMATVASDPDIGQDQHEAWALQAKIANAYKGQVHALNIAGLIQYLLDNDEPLKAIDLLEARPWILEDHPLLLALEKQLRPVVKHYEDPEAYQSFYRDVKDTGQIFAEDAWLTAEGCLDRVKWVASWVNEHCPNARVAEVGAFDGIIGIPLLRLCPGISYTAYEIADYAANKLRSRIGDFGLADRAEVVQVKPDHQYVGSKDHGTFDVLLWFEVIEHVPDPQETIDNISNLLREGGRLFITTPWGSFDAGHPPPDNDAGGVRDSRKHLRAMTPADVINVVEETPGLQVDDLVRAPGILQAAGEEMRTIVTRNTGGWHENPFRVFVPSALWDWNSRVVHRDGIGASEETIVYLAKQMAADGHISEVFGPVPIEEVHHGVTYWNKEKLRRLQHDEDTKIIVSRLPAAADLVDDMVGAWKPKILWLQDAIYPGFNDEQAAKYEKIVVVSEWHKQAMHDRHGIDLDRMVVRYNFLLPEHFRGNVPPVERKRDHFIFASSPDRGVNRLLELWPRILERLPNATLDIFYGWKGAQWLGNNTTGPWPRYYETNRKTFEKLRHQKGVRQVGLVNHERIAQEYRRAGVWAYPTQFEETGCASAVKARAGGAVPVCPPLAALAETAKCDAWINADPENDEAFVEACVAATEVSDADRARMSEEAIEQFGLPTILPSWKDLLR